MAGRPTSAGNIANYALATPLDLFNFESREAPWRKRRSRHYAAARA
jgi:hypothetical protein